MMNSMASSGFADDGNELRYDDPYWVFNLATKPYIATGVYKVTMMTGDDREYIIDGYAGCFVKLQ